MTTTPPAPFAQTIEWLPGPAQGNWPDIYDGERYLCAVGIKDGWDLAVVTVVVEASEEPEDDDLTLEVEDEVWGWEWSDVDWYVPAKFLAPPVPTKGA